MNRREFLKKGSLLTTSLLIPNLAEAKTIKNKYHFIMPPKPFEYFIKEGKKREVEFLLLEEFTEMKREVIKQVIF